MAKKESKVVAKYELNCPACGWPVEIPASIEPDAKLKCPGCGADLSFDPDADGGPDGYRDCSTLSVLSR